jgi:MYXO-CTERM domain-containing protein
LGNSLYAPSGPGLEVLNGEVSSALTVASNAWSGTVPLPPGSVDEGNVGCIDPDTCWVDAPGGDYYPTVDGPLRQGGVVRTDLFSDWCTRLRSDPSSAGAVEAVSEVGFGPVAEDFYILTNCTVPEDLTGTTDPTTEGGATGTGGGGPGGKPVASGETGCGCSTSAPSAPWGLLAPGLACLFAMRRRRLCYTERDESHSPDCDCRGCAGRRARPVADA